MWLFHDPFESKISILSLRGYDLNGLNALMDKWEIIWSQKNHTSLVWVSEPTLEREISHLSTIVPYGVVWMFKAIFEKEISHLHFYLLLEVFEC